MIGTIASGDKIVAEAEARDRLRDAGRNVIGFEMEGHLFAAVVERALGSDRWFMVRAVQDSANKNKDDQFRQLSCKKAAAYVVTFLIDSDLCIPALSDAPAESSTAQSLSMPFPQPATTSVSGFDALALKLARRLGACDPPALLEEYLRVPARATRLGPWSRLKRRGARENRNAVAGPARTGRPGCFRAATDSRIRKRR